MSLVARRPSDGGLYSQGIIGGEGQPPRAVALLDVNPARHGLGGQGAVPSACSPIRALTVFVFMIFSLVVEFLNLIGGRMLVSP